MDEVRWGEMRVCSIQRWYLILFSAERKLVMPLQLTGGVANSNPIKSIPRPAARTVTPLCKATAAN